MSEKTEIGRIKKVGISELDSKLIRLYEVPIVFFKSGIRASLSDLYDQKIEVYYYQLNQWIEKVTEELGAIQFIFMEYITETSEAAHAQVKKLLEKNEQLNEIVERLFEMSTSLEQTEDETLLMEYLAWMSDASGPDALEIDQEYVVELMKERSACIIEKVLGKATVTDKSFLFITIDLAEVTNYPTDIQVIKFRPPVFDDILKMLRNSR